MKSFLVYICIELPKEMGDLTRLKKLQLNYNVNLTLPSDSGAWRLTGLEELILRGLPELKGNVYSIDHVNTFLHEICFLHSFIH